MTQFKMKSFSRFNYAIFMTKYRPESSLKNQHNQNMKLDPSTYFNRSYNITLRLYMNIMGRMDGHQPNPSTKEIRNKELIHLANPFMDYRQYLSLLKNGFKEILTYWLGWFLKVGLTLQIFEKK